MCRSMFMSTIHVYTDSVNNLDIYMACKLLSIFVANHSRRLHGTRRARSLVLDRIVVSIVFSTLMFAKLNLNSPLFDLTVLSW